MKYEMQTNIEAINAHDLGKIVFFSSFLLVVVYAMTVSLLNENWLMAIIDLLLVPVGFVHGLLLLLGLM